MGAWNYSDATFPALPEKGIHGDLTRMKDKLESLGFAVTMVENPNLKQATKAVDEFGATLKSKGGTSLFYFTGHGAEHEGRNYLVPVGTNIVEPADLPVGALSADRVLARMESSGIKVNLVFLDCCRNSLTKSGGETGLAAMSAKGALIGYATRSGDVADTTVAGSPYTNALLAHLGDPGISLPDMHTLVTGDLARKGSQRRPGQYVDLGDIYHLVPVSLAKQDNGEIQRMREELERLRRSQMTKPVPGVPTLADPPKAATPASASKERPFVNMLGMKFVPVVNYKGGKKVLFSIWETRRQDYEAYASANSGVDSEWKAAEFSGVPVGQGDEHPVVNVSWEDATAFAVWLTQRERVYGRIGANDEYRLPTDEEWSYAVGIGGQEEAGGTPEAKDGKVAGVYPWGTVFPPPAGSGNYPDSAAKVKNTGFSYIEGYTDGYATTAEVGSFEANRCGVYDLGGNVWEWCADWYNGEQKYRVLRGGSWYNDDPSNLLSSDRGNVQPGLRLGNYGFRVVLVVGSGG